MDDEPWDVIIPEGEGQKIYFGFEGGALEVKPIMRKILVGNGQIMISGTKVRVGSLGVTKAGLSTSQIIRR